MDYLNKATGKIVRSIIDRGTSDLPVAVYWEPKTCRLYATSGLRRNKLNVLRDQGRLILVGVYGRPWPDGNIAGRGKILMGWMLDDLNEILPNGWSKTSLG